VLVRLAVLLVGLALLAGRVEAQAPLAGEAPLQELTFEEAVELARTRSPGVGEAAQAILQAEALLDRARSVFMPLVYANVGTTVLDEARGFSGNIVQPRTQTAFSGTVSYALLDAVRWAGKNQAADRLATARVAAEETRQQVAVVAAQAYLAVIASERQREIAERNRETARALEDYARARLEAGQGSRLNHVRSVQQRASADGLVQLAELAVGRAREALGVAVFAPGPVGARAEPRLPPAQLPGDEGWLLERPDIRLQSFELQSQDRLVADSWKSWLPTATASFTPRYITPAGLFEPAKSWRAIVQLEIPIFDGTIGSDRRVKAAQRETARLRLDQLRSEARSELRNAREAVRRAEAIVTSTGEAAEAAGEALRITEVAYRAGATTNVEVVQAQQVARNGEIEAAVAEDRLRQARLDLLVALGQFP
jgi:cobalt-zinc-cadmium efflux system outer membrane protein